MKEDESAFQGLNTYYADMAGCNDLLPNDIVCELVRKAHKGDIAARNQVVKHNLRLVVSTVLRRGNNNFTGDIEDKIQFGNIGLIHAVEKYDPDKINPETQKPYAFSTYATWWIKQAIDRETMNTCANIRVPIHALKAYYRVRRVQDILYKIGIVHPKMADYERFFDESFTRHDVEKFETIPYSHSEESPGMTDGEPHSIYNTTVDDMAVDPADYISTESMIAYMVDSMDCLSDKEKTVLTLRFGLSDEDPMTLEDVGKVLGITRERIRQIQVEALKKLKRRLAADNMTRETII